MVRLKYHSYFKLPLIFYKEITMRQLLFIIIPLILTGCGESAHVKNVKSLVYDDSDSSITVGNALSHRDICHLLL